MKVKGVQSQADGICSVKYGQPILEQDKNTLISHYWLNEVKYDMIHLKNACNNITILDRNKIYDNSNKANNQHELMQSMPNIIEINNICSA